MGLLAPRIQPSDNGHDQLAEFEAMVAEHASRAGNRSDVVTTRIQELEAELHALRILRDKLDAASK